MPADKKIKVLRIIARLNVGGPAIHTILLTGGLNKQRFDSLLAAGRVGKGEKDMQDYALKLGVQPLIIPQLQREICPLRDLLALFKIFQLIKKEKPDIIHTHTSKAGTLGRLAGIFYNRLYAKKCLLIHTFHGTALEGYFNPCLTNIFIRIEQILGRFTDKIIAVSESVKNELLRLRIGDFKKVRVIHLGLDISDLLSLSPVYNSRLLKIGIVGRLVPIKNHRMFLEAVKLFIQRQKEKSADHRFYVVGDGELRPELENLAARMDISDNLEFCGWETDLLKLYSMLDLVVLTSLNEGTPLSLIEAMAAAKPVVATEVGGVRDLFFKKTPPDPAASPRIKIFDNGITCDPKDSLGMVGAWELLAADPGLRQRMGEAGRDFVKERFTKERLIKDTQILYNSSLK